MEDHYGLFVIDMFYKQKIFSMKLRAFLMKIFVDIDLPPKKKCLLIIPQLLSYTNVWLRQPDVIFLYYPKAQ